jgi:FkbM family methyltransferase
MRLPFTNINIPIGPLVAPIARLVPESAVVPILTGPARGIRWLVGSGMMNFWLGTYEREKMVVFAAQLRPDMVVYDVGANVGAYTVLAGRRCAAVHAFEPDVRNLSRLRRNIDINGFTNCTVVPAAAGSHDGVANFAEGKDAFVGRLDPAGSIAVRCVSLDDYAAAHSAPDLIKMDIEGGEVEALAGAREIFRSKRPLLFLATHGAAAHQSCSEFLSECDYQLSFLAEDEILAFPATCREQTQGRTALDQEHTSLPTPASSRQDRRYREGSQ